MKKTFSYRMEEQTKKNFDEVCAVLGINSSSASNMFASAVIQRREIPFDVKDVNKKPAKEAK